MQKVKLLSLLLGMGLQSCVVDIIPVPYTPPTYSCLWTDVCHVRFDSVILNLPGTDCETPFYNSTMALYYPYYSCCDLVSCITYYPNDSCQINWITSVYEKQCQSGDSPSQSQKWNQYDFFSGWMYNDIIMESPLIYTGSGVDFCDLKHELTIQIFGVTNSLDNSQGLLTWNVSWIGDYSPSVYNASNHTWNFVFPRGGLKATYIPNSGYPRYIYVHDQFEYL